jgi:putative peptide zinc metalloprotease protein
MRGDRRDSDNSALARYSVAGVGWSFVGAGFAIAMSLRYEKLMLDYAPKPVVYTVMGTIWLVLFIPVFLSLGKPLIGRFRSA